MAKNAEMEIGIFIKDRPFDLHTRAEMLGYKLCISAGLLGVLADKLATKSTNACGVGLFHTPATRLVVFFQPCRQATQSPRKRDPTV